MIVNWQGLTYPDSPELRAAVEAQGATARREISDAYDDLDTLSREAAQLAQRLAKEGALELLAPVTLAAAVARQQVQMALGTERYPGRGGGNGSGGPPWAALSTVESLDAAALLCQELHTLAMVLTGASDTVPATWSPPLWRCASILQQVAAQLQEAVLAAGGHHGARHGRSAR
jgi:hypothetical protein